MRIVGTGQPNLRRNQPALQKTLFALALRPAALVIATRMVIVLPSSDRLRFSVNLPSGPSSIDDGPVAKNVGRVDGRVRLPVEDQFQLGDADHVVQRGYQSVRVLGDH